MRKSAGLNDSKQIVGTYETWNAEGTEYLTHGFLLASLSGSYVALDYPGPGAGSASSGTYVTGINNAGTIVGYFTSASTEGIGFIYRGGTFASYQCKVRGKAVATKLLGISNGGDILVQCNGAYFIRKSHGNHLTAIDYSSLPGAVITALNKFGDVVGYGYPADFSSSYYGFIIPGVVHPAQH